MLRVIVTAAILIVFRCSAEESDREFIARSPDGRFEAVFDQMTVPPLIVREVATNRPMMSMDEGHFCGRGAEASWAPDSTKLVILVHCRLADFMHICRLNTDSIPYFRRYDGPKLPEDRVKFGTWLDNTTLKVEGEKKAYTLKITDHSAAFTNASNKSLEPTAGRRVTSLFMTKTCLLRAIRALANGGSALTR